MVREAGSLLLCRLRAGGGQDCRFRTPISSPFPATSSAARPASARCWSRTSPRSRRAAGRNAAIAAEPRICLRRVAMAAALASRAFAEAMPRLERLRSGSSAKSSALGRTGDRRGSAADRDDRRYRDARRRQRQPARPARPGRNFGFGGKRLLVGKHEAEPRSRRDGRAARRLPHRVIRVSFGPSTTEATSTRFLGEWRRIAGRAKAKAA